MVPEQKASVDNQPLEERIKNLEAKFGQLAPLRTRSRVDRIAFLVGPIFFSLVLLLILTPIGAILGLNVYVLQSNSVGSSTSSPDPGVLAATRNMITVLGPIFIGLTIWLVSVVAERRLKSYDTALEQQRVYIEGRTDKNREYLETQTSRLRTETDNLRLDLRKEIVTETDRAKDAIVSQFRETAQIELEKEKQAFGTLVSETRGEFSSLAERLKSELYKIGENAGENLKRMEERFGALVEIADYARTGSDFQDLSSIGAVHSKVTQLFHQKKRSEALLLTREVLHRFKTADIGNRPSGSLNDWFNLSAQLGQKDEEGLALQVCLSGLEQQNGGPILDDVGNPSWTKKLVEPDDDLLAHAIQYASTIGDSRLDALLKLSGYNKKKNSVPSTWGWRSHMFTMQALASLGRTEEAIGIGEQFIKNVRLSDNSSKVVQTLGSIIYKSGEQERGIQLLENWLEENPNAAAAQIATSLLSWYDGVGESEHLISLASRGIRDLAEEQPSSQTGNLFYRRALARDKRALLWSDTKATDVSDICAEIQLALSDYAVARQVNVSIGLLEQIANRETILRDLAARYGCKVNEGRARADTSKSGPEHEMKSIVQATIVRVVALVQDEELGSEMKAKIINDELNNIAPAARDAVIEMLTRISDDDDVPEELRIGIANMLPLLE